MPSKHNKGIGIFHVAAFGQSFSQHSCLRPRCPEDPAETATAGTDVRIALHLWKIAVAGKQQQGEINESEAKPRILLISCFLLVTCCKAQVRATKCAKVSDHLTDNWRLLVSNLLRTKVAPDDVPYTLDIVWQLFNAPWPVILKAHSCSAVLCSGHDCHRYRSLPVWGL